MPVAKTSDVLTRAQELMREGKVQEADDLLTAHQQELVTKAAPGVVEPPAPAPPLEPTWFNYAEEAEKLFLSVIDSLVGIYTHAGSPPAMAGKIAALKQQHERMAATRPGVDAPGPAK